MQGKEALTTIFLFNNWISISINYLLKIDSGLIQIVFTNRWRNIPVEREKKHGHSANDDD